MRHTIAAALAACSALLAACGGGAGADPAATARAQGSSATAGILALQRNEATARRPCGHGHLKLNVLSSPPQYVSGGDARIEVRAARGLHSSIELWLNGQRLNTPLQSLDNRVEGVITGLAWATTRWKCAPQPVCATASRSPTTPSPGPCSAARSSSPLSAPPTSAPWAASLWWTAPRSPVTR
jgi:hypothetical protein